MHRLTSIFGIILFVAFAWIFSREKKKIPWRTVGVGIFLQIVIALFFLQSDLGIWFFDKINTGVVIVLSHARAGSELVFGALAVPPGDKSSSGDASLGFFLLFQGFPVIIFVAAVMSMLYYIGIMTRIVEFFAWIFSRLLRLSGTESLLAANSIFVGIESVFAIRPFLKKLTSSEMHLLLTVGMATLASSVLAFYSQMMEKQIPGIAGHLVSASLLSAPAAIVMSKILYPEMEKSVTYGKKIRLGKDLFSSEKNAPSSFLDAGVHGAMEGVKLIMGICALLIAFLGIVSLLNSMVGGGAALVGIEGLSFERILGWILYPFAFLSGVKPEDVSTVSGLWGLRVVATEIPAFIQLSAKAGEGLDPRSVVICAYGLCGFAHVAAMAIFVGGTAALVPERRKDLVRLGPRALFAANLACFQTAAIAGLCFSSTTSSIFN
jgi:concentrative nucleoside transporter, CNT family